MSEEIIPDVLENTVETPDVSVKDNLADKTLAELSELFAALGAGVERAKRSKEAEAIKSAFYKKLIKEKAEAGYAAKVDEPSEDAAPEEAEAAQAEPSNPFAVIEAAFKSVYNQYKKEKAEFNAALEKEKEENFAKKSELLEQLKALVDKQEDVSASFPEFREIQNKWREIGQVPAQKFRDLNDSYQFNVEKFYDMVKIDRDLRDLDFKKNLEAKQAFCEAAEKLSENENVVEAFAELQKLHEQWKDFGPVAKEFREEIWDRFKAATSVINKKYQAFFEEQKSKFAENLAAKEKLCEEIEGFAQQEITSSNEWNALSKKIEDIQATWRTIGAVARKDNQKVYDRFRAACDKFFERKRDFYTRYKDDMNGNIDKKMRIIEEAEALKTSTEWKKTADRLIALQKEWKEIGAVPRKKSEQLWKRFRAACDEFFAERDKQAKPENEFYSNLKAKRALIEEIKAYELSDDAAANEAAMQAFAAKWQSIGFVPFKEKENVQAAYREALQAKFPRQERGARRTQGRAPRSEKDILVQRYRTLQQDITTYENNIGFFSMSKNAQALVKELEDKIAASKAELKDLEDKIRTIEEN